VDSAHAPLVEPADDPNARRVTFSYRDDAAGAVLLMVHTVIERHRADLRPMLMRRDAGGDVWHLTLTLPADVRVSYQFHPFDFHPFDREPAGVPDPAAWAAMRRTALPDPANPVLAPQWMPGVRASALVLTEPSTTESFTADPARGTLTGTTLGDRPLWTYLPAEATGPDLPLLVLLDGELWHDVAPSIVDTLVAEGDIPPLCTVLVGSGSMQRRAADLAGNADFLRLLATELPARIAERHPVTDDPARTVLCGQSLGGTTAVLGALHAPHRYGVAVSQSGVFPTVPPLEEAGRVRVHLSVGTLEDRLLPGNRALRAALDAAGASNAYHEYAGGHEPLSWQPDLVRALRQAFR
jgi:enterochelin esterase-like enzyme